MELNTSLEALCKVEPHTPKARDLILETLKAIGPDGLTADQVAHVLDYKVLYARPRVAELYKAKLIAKTGKRRKNSSGLSAAVWCAV